MEKNRTPGQEPRAGEQPTGEWAASQARGVARSAQEGVEQAVEYAQGAVEKTREKVAAYREGGFDQVKHDVMTYTRERPGTSLLLAAGVGLTLGLLMVLGRK